MTVISCETPTPQCSLCRHFIRHSVDGPGEMSIPQPYWLILEPKNRAGVYGSIGESGSMPSRSFTACRNRCLHPRYRLCAAADSLWRASTQLNGKHAAWTPADTMLWCAGAARRTEQAQKKSSPGDIPDVPAVIYLDDANIERPIEG
jgi:hypothetical protein